MNSEDGSISSLREHCLVEQQDPPGLDRTDHDASRVGFAFTNTYARLPEHFYARLNPTPVAAPRLIQLNEQVARDLGLDPQRLATQEGVEILAGNRVAEGAEPLAQAYAGHQFGYFVPQLGDGRANLLGEVVGQDGQHYDIQLKGSGPTPFSRRGDGRAALGPVLREYIVSEAMAALGVPTTRALAAVATGQPVLRETALPGAVLTRVAASHLRVGTFQYFAARGDTEATRRLADYAIDRHYPEILHSKTLSSRPYRSLLDGVISRHGRLVAQWMLIGFVHGVMNTDNTSISGETIDYGPCAFMEAYDPDTVFSSIDQRGRYSYGNQPLAAHWNLTRLAEALLPLLEQEAGSPEAGLASAQEALAAFEPQFESARLAGMRRKLGLGTERGEDAALVADLLQRMAANHADFTLTFRRLCNAAELQEADAGVRALFTDPAAYDSWAVEWRERLAQEPEPEASGTGQTHEARAPSTHAGATPTGAISAGANQIDANQTGVTRTRAELMRTVNPAIIPRNHIVEAALQAAVVKQDFQPFADLLEVLAQPYEERAGLERYAAAARPEECVLQTFCGT